MRFSQAVDLFIADWQAEGRINSVHTERIYRDRLDRLGESVGNRDPRTVSVREVKTFLSQWHDNSRRQAHAIVNTFFDYAMYEEWRKDNPARQVRPTKRREPQTYRLTRAEVVSLLDASLGNRRDKWVIHLGICAGLRSQEIRGLQGRHLMRPGWVWVSTDIGKGHRARWVPVLSDLAPVVEEILTLVGIEEYVIPGRRIVDPPWNTKIIEDPLKAMSASGLYRQVLTIGERAGIAGRVTPHVMRHAYGDHIARFAGLRVAQALMGHEDVSTTAGTYTDRPSLDELAAQVRGFSFFNAAPGSTEVMSLSEETDADMPGEQPNAR